MRNRNIEEEREREEGETSGGNFADTDLDTGETTRLLPLTSQTDQNEVRVKNPESEDFKKFKKNLGLIKRLLNNDKKNVFKDIFDFTPEKKNGKNNNILLEKTRFVNDGKGNVSIIFKDVKIGNIIDNKPELFVRKNKTFVNEFRDIFEKAKQEYKKTPDSIIDRKISDENPEMKEIERKNIVESTISQIDNEVNRIIDENNLIKLVEDENDPRRSLFDSDELREFRGVIYLEDIDSNLSENEKKEVILGK